MGDAPGDAGAVLVAVPESGPPVIRCAPRISGENPFPAPRFISATEISDVRRETADRWALVRRDLASGAEQVAAASAGTYGWSPDGRTLVIFTGSPADPPGMALHLFADGGDRTLARFGVGLGRGGDPSADLVAVRFSPSGQRFVAVNTLSGDASRGAAAVPESLRVFAADGRLLLMTAGTMPVWAAERLYFRDARGVHRWEGGTTTVMVLPGLAWIGPASSPEGARVAFVQLDAQTGEPSVSVYDTATGQTKRLAGMRSRPVFASAGVLWWYEEESCSGACLNSATRPTGRIFAYDLASGTESLLPFSVIFDVLARR